VGGALAGAAAVGVGASQLAGLTGRSRAEAATGTIADLKHVVILMQENRSFDHYYGTLRGVRGFADKQVLRYQDGRTVTYTLTVNDYAGTTQTVTVGANGSTNVTWPVDSDGYYDVVITANTSDGFTRRYAGRIA
jgi:phospholipase C